MEYIIFIIFLTIGVFLIGYMYRKAKSLTITNEVIHFPIKIKEKKLLFISDLHRRRLSKEIIHTLPSNIDFVVIGGDLAEKGVDEDIVKENLNHLRLLGKLYFVWGNNDYEFGEDRLREILQQFQVEILENRAEIFVEENRETWSLVGVGDYGTMHANVDIALKATNGPVLFISHHPSITEEIKDKEKLVAVLSGHTHGGQIRLGPFGIADKGGWKEKHGLNVFISNGFGTRSLPLRLGAEPQIHIFTLK